mgnify:CR=1 FL=1
MKPLDPRLLRYARSTRGFIAVAVVLGAVTAVLVIVQARLLSDVIVSISSDGGDWQDVRDTVAILAAVFVVRASIVWLSEVAAVRASASAKQELRQAAMAHVIALGPQGPAAAAPGETAALVTRGVDALDGYYARYLPQLMLAVIVPVAVLLTMWGQDILSTVIVAVTIPLIPIFMVLIGLYTRSQVDRQWRTLSVLSGHFLDLVSGLPALKAFGRAKTQAEAIRAIGDRYRSTTMGVLRVSFLSSLALELLATLSVALVAVSVGLRLAEGQIAYSVALFVLILAPEAYLPLRLVGQHFHAAAEGLGAADRVFTILETPLPTGGSVRLPDGPVRLTLEGVAVTYPGRPRPALGGVTFTAEPGTVTAIVGGSGGGKSTLIAALLGFVPLSAGSVRAEAGDISAPIDDLDLTAWRSRIAWLPQQSHVVDADLTATPTVLEAVTLRVPDAGPELAWAALTAAGLADEVRALPDGIDTPLAADGSGLSIGQLQRLSLARALLGAADVVLLDEPTAALDPRTEDVVVEAITQVAARGATVLVVAHRPALVAVAHQLVRIEAPAADDAVDEPPASAAAGTIAGAGW